MELRSAARPESQPGSRVPTYRVDLDLPPHERYRKLSLDFAHQMRHITPLFDQVIASVIPSPFLQRVVKFLARVLLRRVYSSEETEELRGISKASGVELYILVAFNLLLDSLLGCTSGGVTVRPSRRPGANAMPAERMMHFRTLDWGMDELRRVLVALEFVRSKSEGPETVLGRSISYVGFVGVLTGVRRDLSLSLNFRPNHSSSTVLLRLHQFLVLLALRPSISSVLRKHFFDPRAEMPSLAHHLQHTRTAPAYIILCSGRETSVVQTDLRGGQSESATDYLSHTNHDLASSRGSQRASSVILGMEGLVEESEERKGCIDAEWRKWKQRQELRMRREGRDGVVAISERTLKTWVMGYPIMNECSHFGCILDPATGTIRWLQRGTFDDEGHDES